MPSGRDNEIKLPSLDELFSSQQERDEAKLKHIYEIPIDQIDPFPDHPFKVRDDEDMMNLIESIRAQGVLTPCMVRKKKDGRYELISGHRRKRACELLGMDTLRCEIVELSKEQATIIMTESNFQRSTILPSEKAFAYKMRLDAMKLLVSRMVENQKKGRNFGGAPVEPQLEKAREHLVNSYGLSEEYAGNLGSVDSRKHDHGVPVAHLGNGKKSRRRPVSSTRILGASISDILLANSQTLAETSAMSSSEIRLSLKPVTRKAHSRALMGDSPVMLFSKASDSVPLCCRKRSSSSAGVRS